MIEISRGLWSSLTKYVLFLAFCVSVNGFKELLNEKEHRMLQTVYAEYDQDFVDRFLAGRSHFQRILSESNNASAVVRHVHSHVRSPAAKNTLDVEGLKNEEIMCFITSAGVRSEALLWQRVIPAARTWMKNLVNAYVIIEDSMLLRFALRQCRVRDYTHYTLFDCHHEPTYVLSRKCNGDYGGWKGNCCKVDDILNLMMNEQPELFAKIKYVVGADDDLYWRVDQLMRFLGIIERSGLSNFPIIGNAAPGKTNDFGAWHIKGCKEIMATGWYQPFFLNRAGMERVKAAVAGYGISDTCRNFDLMQDVGIEIFAWLMELYHVMIPKVEINGNHLGADVFHPRQMAVHGLKADHDKCDVGNENEWPAAARYNQGVATGCGDVSTTSPFHNAKKAANMYDAHQYFLEHGSDVELGIVGNNEFIEAHVVYEKESKGPIRQIAKFAVESEVKDNQWNGEPVEKVVIPRVNAISGYSKSSHGQANDIKKQWKEYTMKDCGGSIDK